MSNSLGKTIFAGVKLYSAWQGKSDSHHRSEFIYKKYMDEGYKSVADNVSFHAFENLPEQFQITITAPNYKPYIYVSKNITGISSNISAFINVFPNPAIDYINVDFNLPEGQLHIYNLNGDLMKEQQLSYGSNTINISDLPEGFLILNLIGNEGTAWFKIVNQR